MLPPDASIFDRLSAGYISEFGSPIKINGPIIVTPGNYSV
jgi:hypothetical protein